MKLLKRKKESNRTGEKRCNRCIKGFITSVDKAYLVINKTTVNLIFEEWKRLKQVLHKRGDPNGQEGYAKMLNNISYLG